MINPTEYNEICKLIKKGDLNKLQSYVDLLRIQGNLKYLKEAREALAAYLDYYSQPFIKYLDDTSSRENPLVESLFKKKEPESTRIIISDNVSGGFILNTDEILDGSEEQRQHILRKKGLSLSVDVDYIKEQHSKVLMQNFNQIDKKKLRLVSDVEKTKKEASVYGNGWSKPHHFEITRYNSIKLLGEDAKIYVSSPKSTPLLYGESSKGKGLILGLRV